MATTLNGRYELLDKLGEGGMAIVYRAHDTLLDRTVAVKVLRQTLTADPAFLERFRRESQAAARLSHPNVVTVYDVGQDGDQHYIVMEFVDGQDLKALISSRAPLPVADALAIAQQVCAALQHAHSLGFVHRDIKPQNILIAKTEGPLGGALVKVTDFGLVKSLNGVALSEAGFVFGTVQYLSPEQARGEPATPQSDIYAVGVVLYEMLTARLPFDSDTAVGLALKHIQETPLPPSRLNPRLTPALDGMVLQAMAKIPADRYLSAAAMGAALAAYRELGEAATGRIRPVQPAQPPATSADAARPRVSGREAAATTPRPQVAVGAAPSRERDAPPPPLRPPAPPVAQGKQRGFDWFLVILLLVTFAAIAGIVPLAYAVRDAVFPPAPTPQPQVRVPNIVGQEQGAAAAQLQALGLTLVVQDARADERVPAQQIIAQLVPPGTPLPPGDTVEVIVSTGRAKVRVPQVTGLVLGEAQAQLTGVGLRIERSDAPSAQVPAGSVIAQEPPANTEVERGSTVRITVSIGNRVAVPDLFGKPEAEAQRLIQTAGLATTFVNYQAPEDVAPENRWVFERVAVGSVVSQSPQAGTLVERGTVVKIAVRSR